MVKETIAQLKTAALLLVFMSVLTGLLYPLVITLVANTLFPAQANGSLVKDKDKTIGSLLIGQYFTSPGYFWGRPSATLPFPYNGQSSRGSNSGPSNPDFLKTVKKRIDRLKQADPDNQKVIPVDLVSASASGLDPDISPLAAYYQVSRIAKARNMNEKDVQLLIESHIKKRYWGLLGEPRVNVLQLNLALDKLRTDYGR